MIEYLIGYGSIAVVVLWISFMIVRARIYKKPSLSNCDMNCATCRTRCEEEERKEAKDKITAKQNKTSS